MVMKIARVMLGMTLRLSKARSCLYSCLISSCPSSSTGHAPRVWSSSSVDIWIQDDPTFAPFTVGTSQPFLSPRVACRSPFNSSVPDESFVFLRKCVSLAWRRTFSCTFPIVCSCPSLSNSLFISFMVFPESLSLTVLNFASQEREAVLERVF